MNKHTASCSTVLNTQPQVVLKIGIDVHAAYCVIVTQADGSVPKPPQRFGQAGLVEWVRRKMEEGYAVVSCYEAGPFGFGLHRRLLEIGATNHVIRPRTWDDHFKGVKTDGRDARAMVSALDRFLAGNSHALTVVRVPTVEQERLRSQSRIRESLQRQLKALAQRGRGLALQYGYRLRGDWFGVRRWPRLELPAWLLELLEPLRGCALALWEQVRAQTATVEERSQGAKPCGVGPWSEQVLEREVGDWSRFRNRRQVGSFLGLCPREHSSGGSQQQGSITKAGNGRLRVILCQIAWRLMVRQPDYRLVKKWRPKFAAANARRRKQIIIALARGFAVDWWRLRTGQTTAQKLGLALSA